MSKHTPGPWRFRQIPEGLTIHSHWIDTGNGAPLAEVRLRPNGEHDANAPLIAAAPELLEALEKIQNRLKSSHTPKAISECLSWCARAIAKAKGE